MTRNKVPNNAVPMTHHKDATKEFMETMTIQLPIIENGVKQLGDLWDCRTSAFVNQNLFVKDLLVGENFEFSVIEKANQKTILHNHSLKCTEDKLNIITIDKMMKLELLAELIKVTGSKNFFKGAKKSEFKEAIVFSYDLKTYTVEVTPKIKGLVDETTSKKLLGDNKISATHVVNKVWMGAFIDTSITIENRNNKTTKICIESYPKQEVKQKEIEKKLNESEKIEDKKKLFGSEMIKIINNMDSEIKLQNHLKDVTAKNWKVRGDPIAFSLVPINLFVDAIKIENVYVKLKDTTIKRLTAMLINIYDYDYENCIRNRVYDKIPYEKIIFKGKTQISKEIMNYENCLINITKRYFPLVAQNLKDYKNGKTTEENIITKILDEFEKEFKIEEVETKINKFHEESQRQMQMETFDVKPYTDLFINNAAVLGFQASSKTKAIELVFPASINETIASLNKIDGQWRFFLPLDDILDTTLSSEKKSDEIIEKIRMVLPLKDSIKNIEWIVGKYGLWFQSTPILFLIKDKKIHLVLTDQIDVLIFMHGWKDVDNLSELKFNSMFNGLLSIKSLDQTFSQDKVDYAIQLDSKLENRPTSSKKVTLLHTFSDNTYDKIIKYMDFNNNESIEDIRKKLNIMKLVSDLNLDDNDKNYILNNSARFQYVFPVKTLDVKKLKLNKKS